MVYDSIFDAYDAGEIKSVHTLYIKVTREIILGGKSFNH